MLARVERYTADRVPKAAARVQSVGDSAVPLVPAVACVTLMLARTSGRLQQTMGANLSHDAFRGGIVRPFAQVPSLPKPSEMGQNIVTSLKASRSAPWCPV